MKLKEFFQKAVTCGLKHDPRRKEFILRSKDKNPYSDSQILYGDSKREISNILVGIDIESAELLLADRLRRERKIDLVVSHHPEGKALAQLYKVMHIHKQLLKNMGVKKEIAQDIMLERIYEIERKLLSANHLRTVDTARILDIPLICLHTVADNLVYDFISKFMQKNKPKKLSDVIDLLLEIEEYKIALKESVGPRILLGNPLRPVGKIMVEMTGGTEGSKDVFGWLYEAGVRTLICMHLSEEHFKKVKDRNLNVIIAGHISSDTLGLNLLLDEVDSQNSLNIFSCSGFRRIKHH
ncbi:MAG: NGG1p interacting factor NIF3 [Candidatus Omnitrophica bacterium]|nr:NGG1p interacting factor NIF3 [Candidatus Omnitrophota bacterium]